MGSFVSKPAPKPKEVQLPDYPADTIIVHTGFGRGFNAPSLSPSVVKLETFLRIAQIPYQTDHTTGLSKKGKTPWITYNKEYVGDSELCIRYLSEKFDINLQGDLSGEEWANMYAFRVLSDEFFYWCLSYERFVVTPKPVLEEATKMPKQAVNNLVKRFQVYMDAQGIGRHSNEEVLWMTENCFKALNQKLGDQLYFFGSKPTEGDCSIFGSLVQCKFQMPGTPNDMVTNRYPKLGEFVDRMKEAYWPDWDECHTHGNTKTPTK